jgi:hypothetical protein
MAVKRSQDNIAEVIAGRAVNELDKLGVLLHALIIAPLPSGQADPAGLIFLVQGEMV